MSEKSENFETQKICEKYTKYKTKNKENPYLKILKTVKYAENL